MKKRPIKIDSKELEKCLKDYIYDDTNFVSIKEARAEVRRKYPKKIKKSTKKIKKL